MLSQNVHTTSGANPIPPLMCTGQSSPKGKSDKCPAEHTTAFSSEVKRKCNYAPTASLHLNGVDSNTVRAHWPTYADQPEAHKPLSLSSDQQVQVLP
jgi:hypothetical protein